MNWNALPCLLLKICRALTLEQIGMKLLCHTVEMFTSHDDKKTNKRPFSERHSSYWKLFPWNHKQNRALKFIRTSWLRGERKKKKREQTNELCRFEKMNIFFFACPTFTQCKVQNCQWQRTESAKTERLQHAKVKWKEKPTETLFIWRYKIPFGEKSIYIEIQTEI